MLIGKTSDGPKFGAARTGVRTLLVGRGNERFAGEWSEEVVGIAAWRGPFGAVEPFSAAMLKEGLYNAVFERMESDHDEDAARCQAGGEFAQSALQHFEFAIHGDA